MAVYSRRELLFGPMLGCVALWSVRAAAGNPAEEFLRRLGELERRHGGRLGVAILDTRGGTQPIAWRGAERFPLCSTHKLLSAAFVLARVDRKEERLERRIVYAKDDLVAYSPITEKHVGGDGLSVGELCEAAITLSDNTAANLLLDSFGGTAGLTAYVRSLGDPITRLDRREPALNEASPGDPRDTTSPLAMLGLVRKTVLGTALSAASRAQLTAWLVACTTGDKRLRAGVPKSWRAGDKTGSGANNTTNDVAVLWPPGRAPIIVTAYYTGANASNEQRELVLAEVGRIATMV
jgi:beta-lactamase class A